MNERLKKMTYKWDNKKPTAQMLGRWQPFHDGHYALFEEIIKSAGNRLLASGVGQIKSATT